MALKVIKEFSDYAPWSGATSNYERLVEENKLDAFEDLLEECYPDGIEEVQINDILWFDFDWVCESLGMEKDESEDEDDGLDELTDEDVWGGEDEDFDELDDDEIWKDRSAEEEDE